MKSLPPYLISFLAGGLYALTYPSFLGGGWFPLLFVALALVLWKLQDTTLKESFFHIFAYNLGLNVIGFYWIPHTLREFGQLPYVISLLLGLLFSFILQPHWWLYILWKRYRPLKINWTSEKGVLLGAFLLTVFERFTPQQFPIYAGSPWLHLAPYLGLTPFFGVMIFSFMTYWASMEIVTQLNLRTLRIQPWICLVVFVLVNALHPMRNLQAEKILPVRIVQANIGNFLKVASEKGDVNSFEAINIKYQQLSSTNNGFSPKLIVWPETAYSEAFTGKTLFGHDILSAIMRETQSEMLIGGYEMDPDKSPLDFIESIFNSSLLLSGDKIKASYHKNILIPFGETLPFGPFNKQIVSIVPAVSLFARGLGTPLLETKDGYRFVTPICYEILESNYMRDLLNQWKDNHFIVNHTNDSWYGDTAEPHQHLFLSKWRALEFELPIIRSTNTGISSVIYPDGSESKRMGIGEENFLDVAIGVSKPVNTFYQRFGAWPFVGLFFLIFSITFWREKNGIRL